MFSSFQPLNLCDIDGVSGISVSKEDEVNRRVDIQIKDPAKEVYMITILLHTCIVLPSYLHTFLHTSHLLSSEPGASIGGAGRGGVGACPRRLLQPRHRVRLVGHPRQVHL